MTPSPSLARGFFEQITQSRDPVAAVRDLINSSPPTAETDWLDFKTEHLDPKQRDRKTRETWSEALGGFANNQGGVLIWGVDARKTNIQGVQIDAACAEKPVTNPRALESRLTELQRQATDPPLANVQIKAYELPSAPGTGFVVCYVPEGPFKPYRSEQAGQQWFLRAGDNFVVMSRSVLQSLFYPRLRSNLEASVQASFSRLGDSPAIYFDATLYNRGTTSAIDMFSRVVANRDLGRLANGQYWNSIYYDKRSLKIKTVTTLHPGDDCSFFSATYVQTGTVADAQGYFPPNIDGIEFAVLICMLNQEPQQLRVVFNRDDLRPGVVKTSQTV